MRHITRLAIIAAMIGLPIAAQAADVPARPVYRQPPPPPAIMATWTGCYVGGNLGAGWSDKSFQDNVNDYGGHTASGFVGGGQIGCDYQIGRFLFGIQGMGEWTNAHGSNTWLLGGNVNITDVRWFSTLTGRIGFVQTASFLLYGKGGGAWVGDQHQITNAAGTVLWTANPTRGGWTGGVGLEWMFAPNWSTFIEYDYLGFGSSTFAFAPAAGGVYFPISVKQNINMVLVGVNYRFGQPVGAVAPRY